MEKTLNLFVGGNLYDASCKLIERLGIEFNPIQEKAWNLAQLYKDRCHKELPEYAKEIMKQICSTYFIGTIVDERYEADTEGYEGMLIFAIDYKSDATPTRTDMATLTRLFNRISTNLPVIAILRQGNLLSIATCERTQYQQQWRQRQGERVGKVSILRDIECTNPHRGHTDILKSLVADKKIKTFDDLYNHWESVFSTELLTKKFYGELFDWYKWVAIDQNLDITFPNDLATNDDDHEIGIHITRLVTRMMFVWFIKQMRLVPDELFDTKELATILNDFKPESKTDGKYYNAILQNLFFATLNQEIPNRRFATYKKGENNYGDKNYYRDNKTDSWFAIGHDEVVKLFGKVPYLNGGLFECLDKTDRVTHKVMYYDGFSREPKRQAHIPNCAFFDKDRGLISIFNRYHFTIEENTPTEQQVALDPELLGKVFENLLGYINPETEETARKQSGSFYTPREIVKYMVDESIVAHLCQHVGKEIEPELRKIVNYSTEPTKLNSQQKADITKAVFNCRILDPACGSGAFPMGVLQQLVHVLSVVDPENIEWQRIVRDNAVKESATVFGNNADADERKQRLADIEANFSNAINHPDYLRKLYLIEHCIYGIDIQPIAIQISKLRFFISLVVNQSTNDNPADNFGIQPLPNLSTKFICANSLLHPLIKDYESTLFDDKSLKELQTELIANRSRYFYARRADKKQLAARDYEICQRIALLLQENVVKPDEEMIAENEKKIKAAQAEMGLFDGENIVTEEYYENATLFEPGQLKKRTYDKNKVEREKLKKIIKECTEKIKKEQKKKKPAGYDAAIRQLTAWDPYDVNSSSPFFDAEWMFGISDGFDIVIGNPPYVVKNKNEYPQYEWNSDLYKMFFEFGLKKALNEKGVICYITPKFWMVNLDDEVMREYFVHKTKIKFMALCNPFENVVTENSILLLSANYEPNNKIELYKHRKEQHIFEKIQPIDIDYCSTNLHKEWIIGLDTDLMGILIKMGSNIKLGQISVSKRGAEISKSIIRETKKGLPTLIGPDLKKYSICYENTKISKEHKEYKRLEAFFKNDLIYLRRVDTCLEAAISNTHYGFNKNIYGIKIKEGSDIKYILGLLNSKAVDFYYKKKFSTKKEDVFPEIQTYLYEQLPIPDVSKVQQRPIIALVDEILAAKEKDPQADTSKLEREIDEKVYELYGLTDEEVKVVEGR